MRFALLIWKKKVKSLVKDWTSVLPQLSVLIALFWIIATPKDRWAPYAAERTQENLKIAERAINLARAKWGTVPTSLVEVKALSKISKLGFSSFDGYGQPLQYIKLSNDHYVLRSFGRDGQQNTLFNPLDPNIKNWLPSYGSTPLYRYTKNVSELALYPSALILGSISPNLQWYAQIYIDQYSGRRQLLIRRRDNPLFLIAPHDQIEEFLWLPDSQKILFTASNSIRYKDGVYLWDIMKDRVANLLSARSVQSELFADNQNDQYYLSIAGANINGSEYYLYIAPRISLSLDPTEFFSGKYLHRIKVSGPNQDPSLKKFPIAMSASVFRADLSIMDHLYGQKKDDKVFKDWSSLALQGDLEETLEKWQQFSQDNANSPIIPYCLWILSSMYFDAYQKVKPTAPQDAEILRSYGAELALGLTRLISPPSYLRAFGRHIYDKLSSGIELSYQISHLTIPKKNRKRVLSK